MTAFTNITEIRCDGPGGDSFGCPAREVHSSDRYTADELRSQLAGFGWETIHDNDLPPIDRCPGCGAGTC